MTVLDAGKVIENQQDIMGRDQGLLGIDPNNENIGTIQLQCITMPISEDTDSMIIIYSIIRHIEICGDSTHIIKWVEKIPKLMWRHYTKGNVRSRK